MVRSTGHASLPLWLSELAPHIKTAKETHRPSLKRRRRPSPISAILIETSRLNRLAILELLNRPSGRDNREVLFLLPWTLSSGRSTRHRAWLKAQVQARLSARPLPRSPTGP